MPISPPPPSAPPRSAIAPPAGTLVRLWVCPACQYDLSGLPDSGPCPECGSERAPGVLHVGGWSDASRVPFGPRARVRAVIFSLVLSIPIGGMLRHWVGSMGVALPAALTYLIVAGAIFMLTVLLGGRSEGVGKRPLEVELRPEGVHFSGKVWSKRLVPWSRYAEVRMKRRPGRLWELRMLAPFWRRHLMETIPWESGFWYVRLVFTGSRRDAALVRRVARRRVAGAEIS